MVTYSVTVRTNGNYFVRIIRNNTPDRYFALVNDPDLYGFNVHFIIEEIDNSGYIPEHIVDEELLNQAYLLFGGV